VPRQPSTSPALEVRARLISLETRLAEMASKDADSELTPATLRAIDALLGLAKDHVPRDDPVVKEIGELFTPELVESGAQPILAADARLLVGMVVDALPSPNRGTLHTF